MGCDLTIIFVSVAVFYFNPRTRMGCDSARRTREQWQKLFQSTHPHGVRPELPIRMYRWRCNFNPRTRMGCDFTSLVDFLLPSPISIHAPAWGATSSDSFSSADFVFQSTHPHGVRHARVLSGVRRNQNFNPRTRMGCDKRALTKVQKMLGFQSTHPHGVRQPALQGILGKIKFQSTHPHGVRLFR